MNERLLWTGFLMLCAACGPSERTLQQASERSATAAAPGVTRLDEGKGPRDPRMLALRTPPGDVDILYGDPDVAGQPFVIRIRELAGTVIPPHTHPVDEHITVLRGTWFFGIGPSWDSTKLTPLHEGDYGFAPAGASMFAYSPDSAIVQVHGVGPFHIVWRDGLVTADDSAASATFRFRRGDFVVASRGGGRIRQAYASGTIVQYEIERADGVRFMAHERDLRRQEAPPGVP